MKEGIFSRIGCVVKLGDYKDLIFSKWVEIIFGLITASILALYKRLSTKIHKQFNDQKELKDGTIALLRSEIIHNYDKYMNRGWLPIYAAESIFSLYDAYHNLGGNGAIDKIIKELKELPSVEQKLVIK